MPEHNIFNQSTTTDPVVATTANPQTVDPFADLLGSIKNERGEPKYKDVQTALEALRHSQEYIPQLKSQKEETDAKLAALAVEVERLKNIEQSVQQLTQQNDRAQGTPAAVGLSADDVANLVNQTLSAKEKQAIASANINAVVSQVQQAFGDKAGELFYTKAEELGMTKEQINNLAAQSPTAVLKLFGLEHKPVQRTGAGAPPAGSINSNALTPAVNTFIGRNKDTMMVGATTADLRAESENSKKLVEELHSKGLTTYDLTDPKQYFKHFGQN